MEKFAGTYEYLIQGGLDALGDRLPRSSRRSSSKRLTALDWTAEQTVSRRSTT